MQIDMLKDDLRKQEEAATAARQEAANFQAERDIERQKVERREADLARADEWRKSLDEREMRQQVGAGWLCFFWAAKQLAWAAAPSHPTAGMNCDP